MIPLSVADVREISAGYHDDPGRSYSLRAAAYVDPQWLDVESQRAIFARTWQWDFCASEARGAGQYVVGDDGRDAGRRRP